MVCIYLIKNIVLEFCVGTVVTCIILSVNCSEHYLKSKTGKNKIEKSECIASGEEGEVLLDACVSHCGSWP